MSGCGGALGAWLVHQEGGWPKKTRAANRMERLVIC